MVASRSKYGLSDAPAWTASVVLSVRSHWYAGTMGFPATIDVAYVSLAPCS